MALKWMDHSRCCKSKLDRLRHELDRGMKALEHEEKRWEHGGKPPRSHIIGEYQSYVTKCRVALAEAEQAALADMGRA